jgi:uncharacterized membrane protein
MPEEKSVFDIKREIQGTAKALIDLVLLSIPVFLYLLSVPVGREVSLPANMMLIASAAAALGALVKTIDLIIRKKFPDRECIIETVRYFFPLYLFLCNTIFTLILYALFYRVFPHLVLFLSKAGLTGLPAIVTIIGLPAALIGFTADKLIRGAVKIVAAILD